MYTNHHSLQWMHSMKSESALLFRWAAQLEDYQFDVIHRPGKDQGHVDGLNRLPLTEINLQVQKKPHLDRSKTKEILQQLHKDGHAGVKKLLGLFKNRYQGTCVRKYCQQIVRECHN